MEKCNVQWVRLGDYIEEFNERNTQNNAYPFIGINRDKTFMPTVANVGQVDISKYKTVTKGMFVFSGMQTGRDECIRIGLYDNDEPALISPAYTTFTLNKKDEILPEFLFIYFNREESDRYGWFISDSSVRANLDWPRFLDIQIPLPSLAEQQKVVNVWKAFREIKEQNEAKAAPLMQVCQSYIQRLKHQYPLQEIGPYIEECNERNKDNHYGVNELKGVTNEGIFDNSKAKLDGLVFTNYKVVHKNDFAYNPSRINLGSIALSLNDISIISPMYIVFHIKGDAILPEFLSLWFRRKEFQRSTKFYVSGSVRDTFGFKEMCNVKIPIPPIGIQHAIVNIYKCANEAKEIEKEADRLSREVCPALMQHVIHS